MSDRKIDKLEKRVQKLEEAVFQGNRQEVQHPNKKLSVREFMQQHDTSSHRKKVLVIGYYLEKYEGYERFSSSDLEDYYRKAKIKISSNTSQFINECAEKAWMMEGEEKNEGNEKTWIVTQTGEDKVENDLREDS